MTHKFFLNFPKITNDSIKTMLYAKAINVPNNIDVLFNGQPFNATLVIIFPTNRIGSNSDIICKKYCCPSTGHIVPGIKNNFKINI